MDSDSTNVNPYEPPKEMVRMAWLSVESCGGLGAMLSLLSGLVMIGLMLLADTMEHGGVSHILPFLYVLGLTVICSLVLGTAAGLLFYFPQRFLMPYLGGYRGPLMAEPGHLSAIVVGREKWMLDEQTQAQNPYAPPLVVEQNAVGRPMERIRVKWMSLGSCVTFGGLFGFHFGAWFFGISLLGQFDASRRSPNNIDWFIALMGTVALGVIGLLIGGVMYIPQRLATRYLGGLTGQARTKAP